MEQLTHTKITAQERDLIAVLRGGRVGIREIARRLKRSPGSICEEIKRNSFQGYYVAIHAQNVSWERKLLSRKRYPLKDPVTYAYVLDKLRLGWSPEQIDGRLKKEAGKRMISHESIYQFIYAKENKEKRLWEYLPLKRVKRRKKLGRKVHKEQIKAKISIHLRSREINQRQNFGHWEGDTVEGKNHYQGIRSEVERVTRFLMAIKLSTVDSQQTLKAQMRMFGDLPKQARISTTVDNGSEHAQHLVLKENLGVQTYFADPYSSWQRGTNEYTNGLLRRYLPKGSSFTDLTQNDLDDIVWEINNRPRKVLKYNTPEEIFNSYLGVRIQS